MNKIITILSLQLVLLSVAGQDITPPRFGYFPDSVPGAPSDDDFQNFSFLDRLYGFSGFDYSKKDLTHLTEGFMSTQVFNNHTRWPSVENLPPFFNPSEWIEESKNPGMSIEKLHSLNIRGKGMSVAIIDKPINQAHTEFEGRIVYIEVFDTPGNKKKHFHGIACASILAGKSCGILPEANLWYFAVPDDGKNSLNYLAAFERLFYINDTLPEKRKIRIVSISDAIDLTIPEVEAKWPVILEDAGKRNITVIWSDRNSTHKYFTWGGCPPGKDPDNPENYTISPLIAGDTAFYKDKIVVPADYRTTAGNNDNYSYTYWGTGGFSWAIPWLTGILTAGWSINPDLTVDDLYGLLIETKTATSKDFYTICPIDFIKKVKSFKPGLADSDHCLER